MLHGLILVFPGPLTGGAPVHAGGFQFFYLLGSQMLVPDLASVNAALFVEPSGQPDAVGLVVRWRVQMAVFPEVIPAQSQVGFKGIRRVEVVADGFQGGPSFFGLLDFALAHQPFV